MKTSNTIEFLQGFDTQLNADAVEWCPVAGFHEFLLCGTYQLDESTNQIGSQTRNGYFQIYQLDDNSSAKSKLISKEKVDTAGVLDIKWSLNTHQESPIFGLVNAQGCAQFYSMQKSDAKCNKIGDVVVEKDGLGLAMDWSRLVKNEVITSTSKGNLALVDINEGFKVKYTWTAHEYEAWTCAFDQNEGDLGGDDCKFKVWDLRTNPIQSIRSINKEHSMGVTNVTVNDVNPYIICTGSYDENLREWDTRLFTKPIQTLSVGGGIWRIKYSPFANNDVAVAAMHNGVHIISLDDPNNHFHFMEHESMAYGVDWCHKNGKENHFLLTSCSFYDHSLKLWSWKRDVNLKI